MTPQSVPPPTPATFHHATSTTRFDTHHPSRANGRWAGPATDEQRARGEQAVAAARRALGTPYVWGGNTPGVGLDCSGLTKWAWGEAGVDIPRLAQEQNVGAQVAPEDLIPGDLLVWSGHVAMYVGDGQIIEAGNPVSISGLRTTNQGMAFYGYFRPTA